MSPHDPDYVVGLAANRKAIELRKKDAPPGSPPACIVVLDCEVQGEPVRVTYDTRREATENTTTMRNVRMVLFGYARGRSQNCYATAAFAPIPIPPPKPPELMPGLRDFAIPK